MTVNLVVIILLFSNYICQTKTCESSTQNASSPLHLNISSFRYRREANSDWCSFKCRGEEHIACVHKGECSKPNSPCVFATLDADDIVEAHNELRNYFASGNDPQADGLQVADMMALVWDEELAFLAGCNLKTCPVSMEHDHCHITAKFSSAGQNLAWSQGISDCTAQASEFVQNWYDEIKILDQSQIKSLAASYQQGSGYGHFTQVIWADTTHVGCMITSKGTGGSVECMLACNYGPAGNFLGKRMFTEGAPSSQCPDDIKRNRKFFALCGNADRANINFITVLMSFVIKLL